MEYARPLSATFLLCLSAIACGPGDLPDPTSPEYAQVVAAFYRGVAAAQAGEGNVAAASFQRVIELAPGEPAGWANGGLIALQRREPDRAMGLARSARRLASANAAIHLISSLIEQENGNVDSAAAHLRRAVEIDPTHLRASFALARLVQDQNGPEGAHEARQLIDGILTVDPGNLVALLERARLGAASGDTALVAETLTRIDRRVEEISISIEEELQAVRMANEAGEFDRTATELTILQAALEPMASYRDDHDAIVLSPSRIELMLTRFVHLPSPPVEPAPHDTGLVFAAETLTVGVAESLDWVQALWLSDEGPIALAVGRSGTIWLSTEPDRADELPMPLAGGGAAVPLSAVTPIDYDHDFSIDLLVTNAGGLRLLRRDTTGAFSDVTAVAVPSSVRGAAYSGAWSVDLDLEGDLDLVLARSDGPLDVLRNRGDGTFEPYAAFPEVRAVRDFVWADLDADGDPDAVVLDQRGSVAVFMNHRSRIPQFERLPLPDTLGVTRAIAAADVDANATFDLLLLGMDGTVYRLAMRGDEWETDVLVTLAEVVSAADAARLFVADFDNNGALDLAAATAGETRIWLSAASGFVPLAPLAIRTTSVADVTGDGRLDLLGVTPAGEPRLLVGQGTTDYFSTTLRPRAATATGDRRINTLGIGGEVEARAGLLYQKRRIDGAAIHFGLGQHPQVDVARIIWPNGSVQAEFNLAATNETILTRQRLKGSCPWVFTFNGEEMQFVTDFIWRTSLGLRINAQGDAEVLHSEDWIRIRGDQLVPRDGVYDVRVTAELWESHFFDHVALMVVDHPNGTEVFVDERFKLPAPTPALHLTGPVRPVAHALDQRGHDVSQLISEMDGRYLDTFELSEYQGVAQDHFVEVVLDDAAPADGPLWLVASGWVYPTDASINVAASQGDRPAPRGLALEVPDGQGGWVVVDPDLGFPSGKTKTMLIDLRDVFRPGTPRRLRLRTTMEVYWDRIGWAAGMPNSDLTTRRVHPTRADLRYRGFSETSQPGRRAPELPRYEIASAAPRWRDLIGYYTRFGDVLPLNEAVDDRYVMMNAGDELVLQFPEQAPPPPGWTRDFVLIGDGWVKDGDLNTGFSTTTMPLPYHGLADYARAPGALEDDPAYRRHPEDWTRFHTRYVTPRRFHRALVPDHED